jgi:multimeric flavodoxin WrbA
LASDRKGILLKVIQMAIKVLGICGSGVKGGNVELLLTEAINAAQEIGDVSVEMIALWDKKISYCDHCNWCLKYQEDDKFCNKDDDMIEIYPRVLDADVLLLASPVYVGKPSSQLTVFIDRCFPFARGNHYKLALNGKVGGALTVAFRRDAGIETTQTSIIWSLLHLGVVPVTAGPGGSLGAHALSSINGSGEFDRAEQYHVKKDKHGLKTARSLSKRCVLLSGLLKAGEIASGQSLHDQWIAAIK